MGSERTSQTSRTHTPVDSGPARSGAIRHPSVRPLSILVVDGRRLIADALGALVGAQDGLAVVAVADPGHAVPAAQRHSPDIVLVGAGRELRHAAETVTALQRAAPAARIVLVADELGPEVAALVLEVGLDGLIISDVRAPDIGACLEQVARGHAVLPPHWREALAADRRDPLHGLTKRQLEVLQLLADGSSYNQIASELFISVNTVKFHVRSIFLKLGVRNRMAAARLLAERH